MDGFISYSHDDVEMFLEFKKHLDSHARNGGVNYWADTRMRAGQPLDDRIRDAIQAAHVFLLFMSPGFGLSEYIRDTELPAIRTRVSACGGLIIPVALRSWYWEGFIETHFSPRLTVLPLVDQRVVAIENTRPDERGPRYDDAHRQVIAAVKAHPWGTVP